ncbi:MAG: Lrp/AsnC family transcriptional regulator [Candidatus Neomarinimicrobiota bacterium]
MFDEKDLHILSLLQKNSRITAQEIGSEIQLSSPAVADRIKKLSDVGIIEQFTARLNSKKLGFDLLAFIALVSSSSDHYEDIINNSIKHASVMECHSITGEGSHLLKVRITNSSALEKLLQDIQGWPGVIRTHTSLVMTTYKEVFDLPLKHNT